jgi:hypothetical protein
MDRSLSLRSLANRKAILTQHYGADHPRTLEAHRQLTAAKFRAALAEARAAGLDNLDLKSLVESGRLPAQAAA